MIWQPGTSFWADRFLPVEQGTGRLHQCKFVFKILNGATCTGQFIHFKTLHTRSTIKINEALLLPTEQCGLTYRQLNGNRFNRIACQQSLTDSTTKLSGIVKWHACLLVVHDQTLINMAQETGSRSDVPISGGQDADSLLYAAKAEGYDVTSIKGR